MDPGDTETGDVDAVNAARDVHAQLRTWLAGTALPLWAQQGYDHKRGGFQERLSAQGPLSADARRARVQMRQVYVFAQAAAVGGPGDAGRLVKEGLEHFFAHYRRADGLFRTLCSAEGAVLDDRAFLYDQAFVLLALAESHKVLGAKAFLLAEANSLLQALQRLLKRSGPGFDSGIPERLPLLANPHMHLLEATLAWREVNTAPVWSQLQEELVDLGLTRLIDPRTGALLERFGEDWAALAAADGQLIEPGHLFEWAWLLQRCGGARPLAAARRLIHIGEEHGVHRGVAVNALREDFTLHDAEARLWPQTERLKANARLAVSEARCWPAVVESGHTLLRYLATAPPGLWHDRLTQHDRFIDEPAPASTLYHIVAAILELGASLQRVAVRRPSSNR